jgi:pimeloyl-ACP methyl ester carboxylesterase
MLGILVVLAAVALAGVACGGGRGTAAEPGYERVHFRASDGVLLDGRVFGGGRVGVVLVHMGRPGDTQVDWSGLARLLSGRGYRVLTYDRRGVCPRRGAGCSSGVDDYASSWRDVSGAFAFLRARGVANIVVIGASIGAMSALYAASERRIDPVALIEFGGINHASGYDFERSQVRRINGFKVFLSTRADIYGGADAAREWFRWAAPPKRLALLPGSEHGTDLLRRSNPLRSRVENLLVRYIEEAAPAR